MLQNTTSQGVRIDTQTGRPFCQQKGLAVIGQCTLAVSVLRLLLARSPLDIVRFIVAVIVDAIKRESWRRISHVGVEVFKRLKPSRANSDSAFTVILKGWVLRIIAALFNAAPNTVCSSESFAVSRRGCAGQFSCKATATFCMAALKQCAVNNFYVAARAATEPTRFPKFIFGTFYNDHTSEGLSGKFKWFWHREILA